MNFNSLPFVVLTVATFLIYYAAARSCRWQVGVLILASFVFYGWEQPYLLLLLLFSAAITSGVSFVVARSPNRATQRLLSFGGVAAMLFVLAFFKYDRMIAETFFGSVQDSPEFAHRLLLLPLPIGISFYTFHGISLVVDTFRGEPRLRELHPPGDHAVRTLLYLTFFPQLIAGPIMKARDFLPQIGRKGLHDIDWTAATRALGDVPADVEIVRQALPTLSR